jgi:hypothetical protein
MRYFGSGRCGQSLTEVLVATAVTTILILAAVALISPVLKNDRNVSSLAIGGALSRELLDNVRNFSESNWHNISDLSTSSANPYYLVAASSPFSTSSGAETIPISSTTYARYFYVDEVRRDLTSGDITNSTSNSSVDPASLRVTVIAAALRGPTSTISQVLTRSQNSVYVQTDWSGGGDVLFVASSAISQFASSSNINTTATPGSIILNTL